MSLFRRLFERRPLTVPFRFLSVVPGGAGSVCVSFFLTANGVRLVLDGIVYGYVLLGGTCRVECVSLSRAFVVVMGIVGRFCYGFGR